MRSLVRFTSALERIEKKKRLSSGRASSRSLTMKNKLFNVARHNRFSVNGTQTNRKREIQMKFPSDFDQFSIPQDIIEREKPKIWQTLCSPFSLPRSPWTVRKSTFPFALLFASFLPMFYIFLIALRASGRHDGEGRHAEKDRTERETNEVLRKQMPKIKELTEH